MIRDFISKNPKALPKLYLYLALIALVLTINFHELTSASLGSVAPQTDAQTSVSDPETQLASTGCRISDSFTPEIKYWEKDICRWSEEHQMDPDLIATIMQIESCGNDQAVSATGVRGLFQVTGANLNGQNPFDPNVSMAKGPGKVLKSELLAAEGNVTAAMAGYNGGAWARQWIKGDISTAQFISRLRSHGSGYWRTAAKANAKVNEVKWYAQWASIYFEAKNNQTGTLQKWLDMGGSHLCTRASAQLGLNSNPVFAGAEVEKN